MATYTRRIQTVEAEPFDAVVPERTITWLREHAIFGETYTAADGATVLKIETDDGQYVEAWDADMIIIENDLVWVMYDGFSEMFEAA